MTNPSLFNSRHLGRDAGPRCPLSTVEIHAGAGSIWEEINKFEAWETWNPLYVESKGSLVEGNTLQFAVQLPGMSPQGGKALVTTVLPEEFVRYEIKGLGGLIHGTRFIEIQPLAANHCLVANGEIMGGALGPVLFRFLGERVRQGLEAMNLALKSRLESNG